jgi:dTDP-4-amino-4,6-dideoxygalactose transaminase
MKYCSPKEYFSQHEGDLLDALRAVIRSDNLVLGNELEKFEQAFSTYNGSSYSVGTNSCTDALMMGLLAAGINQGDEVITTALTAPATILSIINAGAVPVIVDVVAPTYCISPQAIAAAISQKTKAVIAVHLHGYVADMEPIIEICSAYDLTLLEDCAQASGAVYKGQKVGNFGAASAFSFYPTKNIACLGDGGVVVCNDEGIFLRVKSLRNYGFDVDGKIYQPGFNSRMDELQAAVLNVLLPSLQARNDSRIAFAKRYHDVFSDYSEFLPPIVDGAVYHQFSLRIPNRDKFIQDLACLGLQVAVHYPYTMNYHPAFQAYCKNIPIAEEAATLLVSLPIQPEILALNFDHIADTILKCLIKH